MNISVIICCYNSSKRLESTLRHLALQKATIDWELIVVDNASTDNTADFAQKEWSKYQPSFPLRVVSQPIPGLSYAREKGIETAIGEIIVFCDDDNWLCDTYIQTAYEVMKSHPNVGIIGGCGEEVCEIVPPTWFEPIKASYALGKQAAQSGYIDYNTRPWGVYGAGMVIRKICLDKLKALQFKSLLSGRKGKQLSSGGDSELCYVVRFLGYDIYYEDTLCFKHFIPKERLTDEYRIKLDRGLASSQPILALYYYVFNNTKELRIKPLWLWEAIRHYYNAIKDWLTFKSSFQKLKTRCYHANLFIKMNTQHDANLRTIQQYKQLFQKHN